MELLLKWIRFTVSNPEKYDLPSSVLETSTTKRTALLQELKESLEPQSAEARLMIRLSAHMSEIISGKASGIELALKDDLLTELYASKSWNATAYQQLVNIFDLLAHQNAKLHILEIGGGTGGATSYALETLCPKGQPRRFKRYLFTDVTPSFLGQAAEKFQDYVGVEYATFDMERELETQGEEVRGPFDVVMASQVCICFFPQLLGMVSRMADRSTSRLFMLLPIYSTH
jgi:predicted O-methyltransferase YrrM